MTPNKAVCVLRNPTVMESALAMHDECLRSLLHKHCGYEVRLSLFFTVTLLCSCTMTATLLCKRCGCNEVRHQSAIHISVA